MHLALVLDLLLVREQVVQQARVVRSRVLQGPHRAAAVDRASGTFLPWPSRHRLIVRSEPNVAAAHLDVVHRVGDPVLRLVRQLPEPAVAVIDSTASRKAAARALVHRPRRPQPQVRQAALQRVDRRRARSASSSGMNSDSRSLASRAPARSRRPAVHHGEPVVAVRAPGQPVPRSGRARPGWRPDGCPAAQSGRSVATSRSSSQMCEPGTPGCASSSPIRRAQSTIRTARPVQVRTQRRLNGMSKSGSSDGPTRWNGTCVAARRAASRSDSDGRGVRDRRRMRAPAGRSRQPGQRWRHPAPPPFM